MPRALEPGVTFDVVLDCDKDKPEGERPRFIYRSLTCREWAKANSFYEKSLSESSSEAVVNSMAECASIGLAGWVNISKDGVEIPFSVDALQDVVTFAEMQELLNKQLRGNVPNGDEKKS